MQRASTINFFDILAHLLGILLLSVLTHTLSEHPSYPQAPLWVRV